MIVLREELRRDQEQHASDQSRLSKNNVELLEDINILTKQEHQFKIWIQEVDQQISQYKRILNAGGPDNARKLGLGGDGREEELMNLQNELGEYEQEIESLLYEEQEILNRTQMLRQMHNQRMEAENQPPQQPPQDVQTNPVDGRASENQVPVEPQPVRETDTAP